MTDISSTEVPLDSAWKAFGSSLGATAGALTALISMLSGVPLLTACGRGALALFGILLLSRIGAFALARTASAPDGARAKEPINDQAAERSAGENQ